MIRPLLGERLMQQVPVNQMRPGVPVPPEPQPGQPMPMVNHWSAARPQS